MSTQNIDDVRRHLFAALDGLADRDRPLDLDRAKAIADVAQTIINSAKVEVDFIRATGSVESRFLESKTNPDELPQGITSIVRHRIAG